MLGFRTLTCVVGFPVLHRNAVDTLEFVRYNSAEVDNRLRVAQRWERRASNSEMTRGPLLARDWSMWTRAKPRRLVRAACWPGDAARTQR